MYTKYFIHLLISQQKMLHISDISNIILSTGDWERNKSPAFKSSQSGGQGKEISTNSTMQHAKGGKYVP